MPFPQFQLPRKQTIALIPIATIHCCHQSPSVSVWQVVVVYSCLTSSNTRSHAPMAPPATTEKVGSDRLLFSINFRAVDSSSEKGQLQTSLS
jgi:hypothetical protein